MIAALLLVAFYEGVEVLSQLSAHARHKGGREKQGGRGGCRRGLRRIHRGTSQKTDQEWKKEFVITLFRTVDTVKKSTGKSVDNTCTGYFPHIYNGREESFSGGIL